MSSIISNRWKTPREIFEPCKSLAVHLVSLIPTIELVINHGHHRISTRHVRLPFGIVRRLSQRGLSTSDHLLHHDQGLGNSLGFGEQ